MERFKKVLMCILFPHAAVVWLFVPVATVMLIYAFLYENANEITVYLSYFLSAYALTVLCTATPKMYRALKRFKQENIYVNMYLNDIKLRVMLSLYISVIMNGAYAVFQLVLGIYHASVWFYALAVYYLCLVLMRVFLLRSIRVGESVKKELVRYRFCGMVLVCLNLALAVIVFFIAWQNRTFTHHPITTIAMAAYTFTSLTMAIINVVRYRKYNSPVFSASKAISLASASVSMLTLETAMFTAFGEETSGFVRQVMTLLTGTAVCIFVLGLAIYMITKANRELFRERN